MKNPEIVRTAEIIFLFYSGWEQMKTQNEGKQMGEPQHHWVIKGFPYLKFFFQQKPNQNLLRDCFITFGH